MEMNGAISNECGGAGKCNFVIAWEYIFLKGNTFISCLIE
jgi:hypothetical protein